MNSRRCPHGKPSCAECMALLRKVAPECAECLAIEKRSPVTLTDEQCDAFYHQDLQLVADGEWWRVSCSDCLGHAVVPVQVGRELLRRLLHP